MLIINFFQPDNNKTIFKYLLLIVWRQMSQRRTTGKITRGVRATLLNWATVALNGRSKNIVPHAPSVDKQNRKLENHIQDI